MKQILSYFRTHIFSIQNSSISLSDLEHLYECLKLGISLEDATQTLNLDFEMVSKKIAYISQRHQGILNDLDLIRRYLKIQKFVKFLSKKLFIKNIYPLILMAISFMMLLFLQLFFLEFVHELLNGMGVISTLLIVNTVTAALLSFKFLLLILFITFIYFIRTAKNRILLYGIAKQWVIAKLYVTIVSYLFSETLLCIWKSNNSMKHVCEIMRHNNFELECQWVAFQIDTNLEKGLSLDESIQVPMLSPLLVNLIRSGLYRNTLIHELERYNKLSRHVLNRYMVILHRSLNLIAFADVFIVVCLYYHVLYQTLRIVEVIN